MTLRSQLSILRTRLMCSIASRPASLSSRGPTVTFCFDDFPRTAYTVGGTILNSFGAHATFYAAPGLMDTSNALGDQFTRDDLEALLEDGHELGCHTFSHISSRVLSHHSFTREVRRGRAALHKLTGYDPVNFAYPYGHVSLRAKRSIGSQMASSRGIYGGINKQVVDLNLLRANSLYGGMEQMDRVESLVARNVESQGWLIFYTHDVRHNHSAFGCTPALLDRTMILAMEKGCRIASIKEVIETLPLPTEGIPTNAVVGKSADRSWMSPLRARTRTFASPCGKNFHHEHS